MPDKDPPDNTPSPIIGTLNEAPLHAALKQWCAEPGARLEVKLAGYVIDIVQPDGLLVEIQTRSFSSMKRKLYKLTEDHPVRLVYPVARDKWIVKPSRLPGQKAGRRQSPKHGTVAHVFTELVSFPGLMAHPNFSLVVLLTQQEEIQRYDGKRGWRRKGWVVDRRRLLDVVEQHLFHSPADLANLLPADLAAPFTTATLAKQMRIPRRLAQQTCYCLREMGVLERVGKKGNAHLYRRIM